MNERHPDAAKIDDSTLKQIEYLTDTLGISWADAKTRLGVQDGETPAFTRDESIRLHPSNTTPATDRSPRRKYESRYDGDTFSVIDTTEKTNKQVAINAVGIAGVRAAMRVPDSELTVQQRAINRAKDEKRGRRW
jgi:hypothetical protein